MPDKIVLVGQAPGPTGPPPGRPLVGGRTGEFLRSLTGLSLGRYLRRFQTMNVLDRYPGRSLAGKGDRFPLHDARLAAATKEPAFAGRVVVFCGRNVVEAFNHTGPSFVWRACSRTTPAYRYAMIPHPSPINRRWNDPNVVDEARQFFRDLLEGKR